MESTAIIIINWNGWKDTIECLESFDWPIRDAHFFILDNHSTDDSVQQLEAWFRARSLGFITRTPEQLAGPNSGIPPQSMPGYQAIRKEPGSSANQITLVLNNDNQGFAGGNNVILRHLQQTRSHRYAWLLNNDTVVPKDSLGHLVQYLEANTSCAFAGSVLLDYAQPELVQCCSVRYYKYLGVSKLCLKNRNWKEIADRRPPLPPPVRCFQMGASLLVDMAKLDRIGLMDETYFMYSEEADWQIRAQKSGYCNGLSWKSVIYHKGTVSTAGRKHLFFYHYNRSAIILTRKNFGKMAALTASVALTGITMLRSKFQLKESLYGLKGILSGWQAA